MTMVILSSFLSLEEQTSYPIQGRSWPPHSSLQEDGSNGHGHTLSLLKPRKANFLFHRAQVMATSQPPYWKIEGDGHDHTPSLLLARRADFLLCRG